MTKQDAIKLLEDETKLSPELLESIKQVLNTVEVAPAEEETYNSSEEEYYESSDYNESDC
jgi:hypothetical protein